ncbi:MAG: hypothetical protein OXC80_00715 [Gammaproteobacteria bacterium]|nr:hypothetical protein [Gammaproteobacteria bacterium]
MTNVSRACSEILKDWNRDFSKARSNLPLSHFREETAYESLGEPGWAK